MVRPRYLGATSVRPRRLGAPAQRVDMEQAAEMPVEYGPTEYTAGDVTQFGMGFFTIPATAGLLTPVQTPVIRPDRPFTPQKLGCPSTQFGLFLLEAKIEGTNILASSLGVAIEMYSEVSTFPQIEWPTIQPSTGISFIVANPSTTALLFAPTFYGTDVRR